LVDGRDGHLDLVGVAEVLVEVEADQGDLQGEEDVHVYYEEGEQQFGFAVGDELAEFFGEGALAVGFLVAVLALGLGSEVFQAVLFYGFNCAVVVLVISKYKFEHFHSNLPVISLTLQKQPNFLLIVMPQIRVTGLLLHKILHNNPQINKSLKPSHGAIIKRRRAIKARIIDQLLKLKLRKQIVNRDLTRRSPIPQQRLIRKPQSRTALTKLLHQQRVLIVHDVEAGGAFGFDLLDEAGQVEAVEQLRDELDEEGGFDEEALFADGEDRELAALDLAVGTVYVF
jgi:hypothetical protein